MTTQYLRKCTLVVSTGTEGLDLSQMRIRFRVSQADVDAPNTCQIRVWNLKPDTARRIQKEFDTVVLQAGYEGNEAIIFQGTIKQVTRGRESAIDSFVDIYGADGDLAFNFAVVNQAIAAGASLTQQAKIVTDAMSPLGVSAGDVSALAATGGVLPRGKVLFGLGRAAMGDIANTAQCSWSIQDGKVVVTRLTGYRPGEIVVLNSKTGLVDIPEATNNGVEIQCLLNPQIRIGGRVQIDNAGLNQTTVREQGFPRYTDINFFASEDGDGIYRVLVAEHEGDTRGQEWYTYLTCLSIDPSAAADQSVLAYG